MFIGFHFGSSLGREDRDVLDQPHRGRRRKHVGAARQIFLDDVVLDRAGQRSARRALLVGDRDVERHQPRRGGVDGHRGVHRGERNAVEQRAHVAEVRDRHADLADLAARQHVIAVVAGLGRQIERDREAGLALGEIFPIERIRTRRPSNGRRRCGKSRVCRVAAACAFDFRCGAGATVRACCVAASTVPRCVADVICAVPTPGEIPRLWLCGQDPTR